MTASPGDLPSFADVPLARGRADRRDVRIPRADHCRCVRAAALQCKRAIPTVGDVTLKTDHAFADPKLIVENRCVLPVARSELLHASPALPCGVVRAGGQYTTLYCRIDL